MNNEIKTKRDVELILNALDGIQFPMVDGVLTLNVTIKVEEDREYVDYFRSEFLVSADLELRVGNEVIKPNFGKSVNFGRVIVEDSRYLIVTGLGLGLDEDEGEVNDRKYYVNKVVRHIKNILKYEYEDTKEELIKVYHIRRDIRKEIEMEREFK